MNDQDRYQRGWEKLKEIDGEDGELTACSKRSQQRTRIDEFIG